MSTNNEDNQRSFNSLPLSPDLLTVVGELGYEELTPIQSDSIPVLLSGRDLIGQSKTGSGKTAAFALPILQKIDVDCRSIQALVLCPTRELCAQVAREFRKLGRRHNGLTVVTVSGGEPIHHQIASLQRGVHVVVGTPGRMTDHLRRNTMELGTVSMVVLDEADRMLEMGFEDDMAAILEHLPKSRQTVLFSATFPRTIAALSRAYQRDAVRVNIEDQAQAAPDIRQLAVIAEPENKMYALRWLLGEHEHDSALIFCNLKVSVAQLERNLAASGASVASLHGDLEQYERDRVMARFRNQSVRILVATDVAARGIDVDDLDIVVNYELPSQPEVYVHRIGRTGRAGKRGLSISVVSAREHPKLAAITRLTGAPIETQKLEPNSRINAEALAREAKMDTIQISGGRKDKVRPGDILGALTGESGGLDASDIGKIEIHDRLSYVAVAKAVSRHALKSLQSGRIKGRRFQAAFLQ